MELAEIMAKAVQSGAEYSIIEASSHALDQNRLADIHFKACAFSNLSQDHLDYHKGMDDYFEAKFKLTKLCDHFASNVDDAYGKKIKSMRSDCFSFGLDQRAQLRLVPISSDLDGSKAKLYFKHQSLELSLPIPGKHNLENAMAAISICILSGFSIKDCCEALREMMQIPGRLEKVENALGVSAFVDYAHTPGAVSKVLGALRKVLPREKKIFSVLGCGGNRDKGKRPKMALAALENSDFCFFSSDNPRFEDPEAILDDMCSELKGNEGFIREADRSEAISLGLKKAKAESAVLVVLGKGHEDYQEIKDKRIFMDDRKTIIVRAQEISECK